MNKYRLTLYITGRSWRSDQAIASIRKVCESELMNEYELHIIDLLEQPHLAETEKILATPTLVKSLPPPLRRIIGDLTEVDKVLKGLKLRVVE
jgi:circadian clock protein KaiB